MQEKSILKFTLNSNSFMKSHVWDAGRKLDTVRLFAALNGAAGVVNSV